MNYHLSSMLGLKSSFSLPTYRTFPLASTCQIFQYESCNIEQKRFRSLWHLEDFRFGILICYELGGELNIFSSSPRRSGEQSFLDLIPWSGHFFFGFMESAAE